MTVQIKNNIETLTLTDLLKDLARENSSGITFINGSNEENFLSYASLFENALYVLHNLQEHGLKAGQELVLQVDDNREFLIIFWACILGGIVPVPLSTGNQKEHRLKVFRVLNILNDPFLAIDTEGLGRLKNIEAGGVDLELDEDRVLLLRELFKFKEQAELVIAAPTQLGYIQFSSGSTGSPKGVCLTHQNLIANIRDIAVRSEISGNDSMLSWMPLTHDMGLICFHLTGIFSSINQFILPTSLFIRRPVLWIEKANQHNASLLYSPNFGYHYFLSAFKQTDSSVSEQWDLSGVRLIYNGAEPISDKLAGEFTDTLRCFGLNSNVIFPGYGLAEASVAVTLPKPQAALTIHSLKRSDLNPGDLVVDTNANAGDSVSFVGVGSAIDHTQVRITNANKTVGENIIGNIEITGMNVTSGYINDPVGTQALFTKDQWLKTGDIGFLRNGQLVVVGRAKNMIILAGQNYYPHDIERIVHEKAGVEPGKVVACAAPSLDEGVEQLIVFILFKGKDEEFVLLQKKVKKAISDNIGIEAHAIVPVKKIPKTTSGKVQHFQLARQYSEGMFNEKLLAITDAIARETATQDTDYTVTGKLRSIWNSIFNSDIDDTSDFLGAGMSSLRAIQFASAITSQLHIQVGIAEIFEYPTLQLLSEFIIHNGTRIERDHIPVIEPAGQYRASVEQQRFWLLDQYGTGQLAYNIHLAHEINGDLDVEALKFGFEMTIRRHDILRSRFIMVNDELKQDVQDWSPEKFKLKEFELANYPNNFALAKQMLNAQGNVLFDLAHGPLIRGSLFSLPDKKYVFNISLHHIIADGWSVGVIMENIIQYYKKYRHEVFVDPPRLLFQYGDYVAWKVSQKKEEEVDVAKKYWLNEFSGTLPIADLSYGKKRPAFQTYQGRRTTFEIPPELFNGLRNISKQHNATPFMTLLAGVYILLYKYSDEKDIIIGTDTAGRNMSGLENQVGYFINTLPIRMQLDADHGFGQLISKVRDKLLAAHQHQEFTYDDLCAALNLRRDKSRNPLFDILVLFQNFEHDIHFETFAQSFETKELKVDSTSSFVDLNFEFVQSSKGLSLNLTYNTDLFSEVEVRTLYDRLLLVLNNMANNTNIPLSQYSLLHRGEAEKIINIFNRPALPMTSGSVLDLIRESIDIRKDQLAIVCDGREMTYAELGGASNVITDHLRRIYKVQRQQKIGVMMQRSEDMIAVILAIFQCQAVYVPIDINLPQQRINYIIEDCGIDLLYTDSRAQSLIIAPENVILHNQTKSELNLRQPSLSVCGPDDVAYVLYTSGSTGNPKGVMITHRSLADYIFTFNDYFKITTTDTVLQQASPSFDTSIEEILPILAAGGRLVIVPEGGKDIDRLREVVENEKVTVISVTPLILNELNRFRSPLSLRLIISGGDVLKPAFINNLFNDVAIYNTYGPTESTICTTYSKISTPGDSAIIGAPINNRQVFILDERLQLQPLGIAGEIYIGGQGLSIGYLNREDETARRFISSPFNPSEKIYRTGDMGRWLDDGRIEFLGRNDYQVKIRGYRIEPAEIEAAIQEIQGVKDVVVATREFHNGIKYLVAYYTGSLQPGTSINEQLRDRLPYYMIPSFCIPMAEFPLNSNGKVDRLSLPDPLQGDAQIKTFVDSVPLNPMEKDLLQHWNEVLGFKTDSVTDNFFELGGDSIKATKLIGVISKKFQVKLSLKDFFTHPSVRELVMRIVQIPARLSGDICPIALSNQYPASNAQQRIWIIDAFSASENIYLLTWTYDIMGDLDINAFNKAFQTVIARHESLRTIFTDSDGQLFQQIIPSQKISFDTIFHDLSDDDDKELLLAKEEQEFENFKFDLAQWPLFKASIVRYEKKAFRFLFAIHHIITDGWSINILVNEIATCYTAFKKGAEPSLAPLRVQYKDYVGWQNKIFDTPELTTLKNFWLHQFQDEVPVINLPLDYSRPSIQTYEGKTIRTVINNELREKLRLLSVRQNTTLFIVLLAGVKLLLSKYSQQTDITVGTPVSGRVHKDLEDQLGLFLNILPLRTRFERNDSFLDLLEKENNNFLKAYDHQIYPFDKLVDELKLKRDLSRSPIFDVMVSFQNVQQATSALDNFDGLTLRLLPKNRQISLFDLSIDFLRRCKYVNSSMGIQY